MDIDEAVEAVLVARYAKTGKSRNATLDALLACSIRADLAAAIPHLAVPAAPAVTRAPTPQEISNYLAFCDGARKAAAAPAVEPTHQGYIDAFYEIAKLLGIEGARAESPKWVFENEILPKLKSMVPVIREGMS